MKNKKFSFVDIYINLQSANSFMNLVSHHQLKYWFKDLTQDLKGKKKNFNWNRIKKMVKRTFNNSKQKSGYKMANSFIVHGR